jgi:hypothetical protein
MEFNVKIYFGISFAAIVILTYSFLVKRKDPLFGQPKPTYTVYRATINNKLVTCNFVEHSKLGYNLKDCDNDSRYFNVTNIEMSVGESNGRY